jgi:predicted membrane protein
MNEPYSIGDSMNKSGQKVLAWMAIAFGGILLAANIFQIDTDKIFFPLLLVVVGLILVFRPKSMRFVGDVSFAFASNKKLDKSWNVKNQEFWQFAGDFYIDLPAMNLPNGETDIRVVAFASEIDINLPKDIGLMIDATGFVTSIKQDGDKEENIFAGSHFKSDAYDQAKRKLRLETLGFVSEIDLRT